MWIVRIALDRPYTFVVLALLILILSPLVILRTPTDIFPEHQHPGHRGRLDLHRAQCGGDGRPAHVRLRALADDAGRQHPAHRIDKLQRSGDRQDLPAAGRQPRHRERAGHRRLAGACCGSCRRERSRRWFSTSARPACPILQLGLSGRRIVGAAAQRPRTELPAHPVGHRARRGDPVSVRRQAAAGDDQLQPGAAAGEGPLARRRAERRWRRRTWCCRPARRRSRSSNTTCARTRRRARSSS